eukprot:905151-Prorocentrum_minimum.AAC.1
MAMMGPKVAEMHPGWHMRCCVMAQYVAEGRRHLLQSAASETSIGSMEMYPQEAAPTATPTAPPTTHAPTT